MGYDVQGQSQSERKAELVEKIHFNRAMVIISYKIWRLAVERIAILRHFIFTVLTRYSRRLQK